MKTKNDGFDKTRKILIGIMDILLFHISFIISFNVRYGGDIPTYNYSAYSDSIIYIMIAFVILNILFGLYVFYNKSLLDLISITAITQLIMTILIMALTYFGRWFTFPRSILAINFLTSFIILSLWRFFIFKMYNKLSGTSNILVVGNKKDIMNAIQNLMHAKNNRHKITKVCFNKYYDKIKDNMNDVDIIYLASSIEETEKKRIYDLLIENDKKLFVNTSFENLILVNPNLMNIEDESIIEISNFRISPEAELIKRFIDIIIATILLLISSPIILVTALLIKLTSEGPVFYKQVRITKNQKEFNILKFRTMSVTAEKDLGPVLAASNDTRVTAIGKYLRSLRIDELPQLINVLTGSMSMVGPRPERPFFVNQFVAENKYYYLRHNVRAGITGYAQVHGKYTTDFNSKLNFDLVYIKKYSLLLDIKIMLQTIKVLFDKVSSKGLEENEDSHHSIPEEIKII